jgi:hypothetical protein
MLGEHVAPRLTAGQPLLKALPAFSSAIRRKPGLLDLRQSPRLQANRWHDRPSLDVLGREHRRGASYRRPLKRAAARLSPRRNARPYRSIDGRRLIRPIKIATNDEGSPRDLAILVLVVSSKQECRLRYIRSVASASFDANSC